MITAALMAFMVAQLAGAVILVLVNPIERGEGVCVDANGTVALKVGAADRISVEQGIDIWGMGAGECRQDERD